MPQSSETFWIASFYFFFCLFSDPTYHVQLQPCSCGSWGCVGAAPTWVQGAPGVSQQQLLLQQQQHLQPAARQHDHSPGITALCLARAPLSFRHSCEVSLELVKPTILQWRTPSPDFQNKSSFQSWKSLDLQYVLNHTQHHIQNFLILTGFDISIISHHFPFYIIFTGLFIFKLLFSDIGMAFSSSLFCLLFFLSFSISPLILTCGLYSFPDLEKKFSKSDVNMNINHLSFNCHKLMWKMYIYIDINC